MTKRKYLATPLTFAFAWFGFAVLALMGGRAVMALSAIDLCPVYYGITCL